MRKIVFTLALSIVMLVTGMAQEKPVVKASANTTQTYETTGSSSGGSWSERPYIKEPVSTCISISVSTLVDTKEWSIRPVGACMILVPHLLGCIYSTQL